MTSSGPRPVGPDDIAASVTLSAEAFGSLPAGFTPPSADTWPLPGRHSWGTWDGDRLVARVMGREYHSWWHGRAVPTCGIAAVAVAAERRGSGLLDPLMATVLEQGLRERGEVVSTLFPTAPGIYRRYGYEVVTSLLEVELATAALARVAPDPEVTLRRATAADVDDVRRVYATWAAAHNGPLTRTGPSFPDDAEEVLAEFTAITLAVVAGEVVGFCSWHRGSGYDDSSVLEVDDLVSLHAGATRSLWAPARQPRLGDRAGAAEHVRRGPGPARAALRASGGSPSRSPTCCGCTTCPARSPGSGWGRWTPACPSPSRATCWARPTGHWLLTTDGGTSTCVAGGPTYGGPVLAPRGLALLYVRRPVLRGHPGGRADARRRRLRRHARRPVRRASRARARLLLSAAAAPLPARTRGSYGGERDVGPHHEPAVGLQPDRLRRRPGGPPRRRSPG